MIVAAALLVPGGDLESPRREVLCTVSITNDGTGSKNSRNYDVELFSRGKKPRRIRTARIERFPAESLPAWRLIARAFQELEK